MKKVQLFPLGTKVPLVPLKGGMEPELTLPGSVPFYPLGAELDGTTEVLL